MDIVSEWLFDRWVIMIQWDDNDDNERYIRRNLAFCKELDMSKLDCMWLYSCKRDIVIKSDMDEGKGDDVRSSPALTLSHRYV